ncbi:MAG TPA: amidohydrolase [archaeon]|nr:amidohydrolase [archaeon]
MLIKNCSWLVTQNPNRDILRDHSIMIDDGKIIEIGSAVKAADVVVDGAGKIALPGLINTHTHLSMVLLRGYADDMRLQDWLQEKIWPVEVRLTPDACYKGALLGCAEMIMSGTTTFIDMYFNMEDVARAVKESGLRALLSYGIIDLFDSGKAKAEQEKSRKFFEYVRSLETPRIQFALGPHAPYTCSPETLLWAREFAEKHRVINHIHIAETRKEQADSQKQHGARIVEYLDKIGALSSRMLAAHCVWLTKSEVTILAKAGVKVAHCPVSNMKLASGGVTPLPEMFDAGIPVGLGTDGAASNNSLDMFDTMKVCALLHKAHRWDPTVLDAQKTLDLATIEGARALGIQDEVGSIEVGKKADIIMLDMHSPNLNPIHAKETIISDLVYSASPANVDTTIVDGQPLMVNRKLLTLDIQQTIQNAAKVANELVHP